MNDCPDDLRSLSTSARAKHVATCVFCASELALGDEAADARVVDAARVDRLVRGALEVHAKRTARQRTSSRWVLLAAAAAVFVAMTAAATPWRNFRARRTESDSRMHETTAAVTTPPPGAPTAAAPPEAVKTEPAAAEPEPSAKPAPAPAPRAATEETWTSSTLFASANAARRRGDLAQATAQYRLLVRKYPTTDEAATAHVSLGLLLLDQKGDARGALAELDRYLADGTHSSLREQCLVGRARALSKLGRHDDEKRAWSALLREYPDSLSADMAHARMAD
jgi:TolA-binding protein